MKPGMIALHAGSPVYVSKEELVKIFDPKPSVYTCKLGMLLFGQELTRKRGGGDALAHLNAKKLKSLIS